MKIAISDDINENVAAQSKQPRRQKSSEITIPPRRHVTRPRWRGVLSVAARLHRFCVSSCHCERSSPTVPSNPAGHPEPQPPHPARCRVVTPSTMTWRRSSWRMTSCWRRWCRSPRRSWIGTTDSRATDTTRRRNTDGRTRRTARRSRMTWRKMRQRRRRQSGIDRGRQRDRSSQPHGPLLPSRIDHTSHTSSSSRRYQRAFQHACSHRLRRRRSHRPRRIQTRRLLRAWHNRSSSTRHLQQQRHQQEQANKEAHLLRQVFTVDMAPCRHRHRTRAPLPTRPTPMVARTPAARRRGRRDRLCWSAAGWELGPSWQCESAAAVPQQRNRHRRRGDLRARPACSRRRRHPSARPDIRHSHLCLRRLQQSLLQLLPLQPNRQR